MPEQVASHIRRICRMSQKPILFEDFIDSLIELNLCHLLGVRDAKSLCNFQWVPSGFSGLLRPFSRRRVWMALRHQSIALRLNQSLWQVFHDIRVSHLFSAVLAFHGGQSRPALGGMATSGRVKEAPNPTGRRL
jgi:hypothetical protein